MLKYIHKYAIQFGLFRNFYIDWYHNNERVNYPTLKAVKCNFHNFQFLIIFDRLIFKSRNKNWNKSGWCWISRIRVDSAWVLQAAYKGVEWANVGRGLQCHKLNVYTFLCTHPCLGCWWVGLFCFKSLRFSCIKAK